MELVPRATRKTKSKRHDQASVSVALGCAPLTVTHGRHDRAVMAISIYSSNNIWLNDESGRDE
jgi:hypothetical protein